MQNNSILMDLKYSNKIQEILEVLKTIKEDRIGILDGRSGLLFFFYEAYKSNLISEEYLYIQLKTNIELILVQLGNKEIVTHTLCSGVAGFLWTLEKLFKEDIIDREDFDFIDTLEEYIIKFYNYDIDKKNWDLLHGAIGSALYFLEKSDSDPKYNSLIKKLISYFEDTAIQISPDMIAWESVIDYKSNLRGFNLGLAHGIPSAIFFLSLAYEKGIEIDKCLNMINKSMKYLLSQQNIYPEKIGSYFSTNNNIKGEFSRLAWCYGDLGLATSLYLSSRRIGNSEWEKEFLKILKFACLRRDPKKEMVFDAGFCHGSVGNAYIFNKLYNYTNIDLFKKTAQFWYNITLEKDIFTDGLAGYTFYFGENNWFNDTSLLNGITGIGLVLLNGIYNTESLWDRSLMLS